EAAPVLTVSEAGPGKKSGNVGLPIPGVELKIIDPNDLGIGEVAARGPNVMLGYYGNDAATASAIDADGWLRTGDMGKLDHRGRLVLMGRAKEVVVTASGENIYLDDVENTLGQIRHVKEYALVGVDDERGGERLGMLAVMDDASADRTRPQRYDDAMRAINTAISNLPAVQRPAVIKLVDAELPRTATRKVQRKTCTEILQKIIRASPKKASRGSVSGPVAQAVAAVAGVPRSKVTPETRLLDDLGFDSLMAVELASALAGIGHANPDPDDLIRCETVADLTTLVGDRVAVAREAEGKDRSEGEAITIPYPVAVVARAALSSAQMGFFERGLSVKVTGRSNIPANRPTIVISNHTSHLDMGLVKYALGTYGQKIVGLAAQDYFFEGNRWWVAYFDQLTNLRPIDRKRGFRASFEQARQVVDEGNVVLVFPEGTRQTDGALGQFKTLIGKLSLETDVDILPLHIDGAYKILPKGAALPRGRELSVRIGPPLSNARLRSLTEGMRSTDAARVVAAISREAVSRLSERSVLDLDHDDVSYIIDEIKLRREGRAPVKKDPIEEAFESLPERYATERIDRPLSWYFSLGGKTGPRWTVIVDKEGCQVLPGRPPNGGADCVVKTSPEIMTRIIMKAYTPDPAEFFSGAIKTNEIPLLIEFSRVFNLAEAGQ
ncbi:MAG: long-chain acyl-CoA synthetase, partial [Myxococcota bacterium]